MAKSLVAVCPHCGAGTPVAETAIGKTMDCPTCKTEFVVETVKFAAGGSAEPSSASSSDLLEPAPPKPPKTQQESAPSPPPAKPPVKSSRDGQTKSRQPKLRRLGRFEIKQVLGQGAFGRVYRAIDPQLDREVALKLPTFPKTDERRVLRFRTEARAAANLRHPHIVTTFESGEVDDHLYIAVEYVKGAPLSDRLDEAPPHAAQAAIWIEQIARALQYAHREGIVHRDVKPDNIMLDADDQPRIMDFGLAKRLYADERMTIHGGVMGTPAYMAPEQACGDTDQVGPHSDQYAVGVMLYEMLCGQKPFRGSVQSVLADVVEKEPELPRSVNSEVDPDLEAICLKAMRKEPRDRYANLEAMAEDLAAWRRGAPTSVRRLGLLDRFYRWRRNNASAAAIVLAIVAILLVASVGSAALIVVADFKSQQYERHRQEEQTSLAKINEERDNLEQARDELKRQNELDAKQLEELQATSRDIQAATKESEAAQSRIAAETKLLQESQSEIEETRQRIQQDLTLIKDRTFAANESLYVHLIKSAAQYIKERNYDAADQALRQCDPGQRHWEWSSLRRFTQKRPWTPLADRSVLQVQMNATGSHVAIITHKGRRIAPLEAQVVVIDANNLQETFRKPLNYGRRENAGLAISNSGRWLAVCNLGEVIVWDTESHDRTKLPVVDSISGYSFDGDVLTASLQAPKSINIVAHTLGPNAPSTRSIRKDPSLGDNLRIRRRGGKVWALGAKGKRAFVYELVDDHFQQRHALQHPLLVTRREFDASGRFVYTWDEEKFRVWDVATGELRLVRLATSAEVRAFITGIGMKAVLRDEAGIRVSDLRRPADGSAAVGGGEGGGFGEAATLPTVAAPAAPPAQLKAWSPGRRWGVLRNPANPTRLKVWKSKSGRTFEFPDTLFVRLDEHWLATAPAAGQSKLPTEYFGPIQVIDLRGAEPKQLPSFHPAKGLPIPSEAGWKKLIHRIRFDPEQQRLACQVSIWRGRRRKQLRHWMVVWDFATPQQMHSFDVKHYAFPAIRGDILYADDHQANLTAWDLNTEKELFRVKGYAAVFSSEPSPAFLYRRRGKSEDGSTRLDWVVAAWPSGDEIATGAIPNPSAKTFVIQMEGRTHVRVHSVSKDEHHMWRTNLETGETDQRSAFAESKLSMAAKLVVFRQKDDSVGAFQLQGGPERAVEIGPQTTLKTVDIHHNEDGRVAIVHLRANEGDGVQTAAAIDLTSGELRWRIEGQVVHLLPQAKHALTIARDRSVILFPTTDGPSAGVKVGLADAANQPDYFRLGMAQANGATCSMDARRLVVVDVQGATIWALTGDPQPLLTRPGVKYARLGRSGLTLDTETLLMPSSSED